MRDVRQNLEQVFVDNRLPNLIYANRQDYGGDKHERPMHSHTSLCELLLCYRGTSLLLTAAGSCEKSAWRKMKSAPSPCRRICSEKT